MRREFEMYGAIERVRIVRDKKNHSRGYAFVVYERERDMKGQSTQPLAPSSRCGMTLTRPLPIL